MEVTKIRVEMERIALKMELGEVPKGRVVKGVDPRL
jgi:hypothetical protein